MAVSPYFVPVKRIQGFVREATTIWRSSQFTVRLMALVFASVAFSAVLWMTEPPGPGLQPSSAAYLGAAQSAADGHGFRVPTAPWSSPDSTAALTRYPPGFPMAIALPVVMGLPPVQAARLVEALSAFVAIAVLLALVGEAGGTVAAILFGLALLVTPALVDAHLSVLSEPLFLAMLALTLATMVVLPDVPIVSGLCAVGTLGVRYAGIAAVIAVVLWMLGRPGTRAARVKRALIAVLPTLVVGIAWLWVAVRSGAGLSVARRWSVYGGLPKALAYGAETLARWLVPTPDRAVWALWVAVPAAAVMAALLFVGTRRVFRLWRLLPKEMVRASSTNVPQLSAARLLGACAVLAGSYLAVLLAARLFADGGIVFDDRLMAPLILLLSTGFAAAAANWWRSAGRVPRAALSVLLLAWGIGSFVTSRARVNESMDVGLDFANDMWRGSSVLEWLRGDTSHGAVYSNWPALPYLYLGRPARGLPASASPAVLQAFRDTLAARGGGVIVAFTADNPAFVNIDSLASALRLRVLAHYTDGRVFVRAPPTR